jgi:hypothetical protein
MFPDWWEDIRRVGGEGALKDMARGAEAYLQSWERVNGIRSGCKRARQRAGRRGMGGVGLRAGTARVLRRAGQPRVRGTRGWTWCVRGRANARHKVGAALTTAGKVALVGTNARGSDAARIRVGDAPSSLDNRARSLGGGLYVRRAGPRARFVYVVRRDRVRTVGVGTRAATGNRATLRRYLRSVRLGAG